MEQFPFLVYGDLDSARGKLAGAGIAVGGTGGKLQEYPPPPGVNVSEQLTAIVDAEDEASAQASIEATLGEGFYVLPVPTASE